MTTYTMEEVIARRKVLKDEYEAKQRELKGQYADKIAGLEKWIFAQLKENKVTSMSTKAGIATYYLRRNIKVANWDDFEKWTLDSAKPEFIKHDVDTTEVLAYLDRRAGTELPPGLENNPTEVLSIKAATGGA